VSVERPPLAESGPLLLIGVLLASLLIGAAAVSVARADDGTEVNTGLSVKVIASSASATPTSTTTHSATVGGVSTTNPGAAGGSTSAGATQPNSTTPTPAAADSSVAGVLYVSGLSGSYAPSLNPLGGSLNLRFTVRNVYSQTLSPTANLWINQVFGGPVGAPVVVQVDKLKAGETRTVEATFNGLAQWTVLSAHATLALPNTSDQVVAPISRDTIIWVLPWFIVLLAATAASWILWRRLRPRAALVAEPGPTAAEPDEAPEADDL